MGNKLNIVLALALVLSALSQINAQYQARRLFIDIEREQTLTKQYEIQWNQLRLDQSVLAKHSRIEDVAQKQLNMVQVSPDRTQYLRAEEQK